MDYWRLVLAGGSTKLLHFGRHAGRVVGLQAFPRRRAIEWLHTYLGWPSRKALHFGPKKKGNISNKTVCMTYITHEIQRVIIGTHAKKRLPY